MADVLGRGELSYIVEEPRHGRVAIDILPKNVVMIVAIDIAGAEDVPAGIGETDVLDGSDMAARHQPFRDAPVVTAEQDVGIAVAVEIAGAGDVRARRRRTNWDSG